MAFSIFNKSGQDGKSSNDPTKTTVKSPEATDPTKTLVKSPAAAKPDGNDASTAFPATTAAPTASMVMRPGGAAQNEMMAYDIEDVPQLQEAAALYAADHLDAAQFLLSKAVQDKSGNAQAWLMLLDLYKMRNFKKEFEDLAMTYTVKFERSPPTWNQETPQAEARKETRPNSDFFIFSKDGLLPDVLKLVEFANRLGSARIDLGKIKAITSDEADALAKALVDLRKRNVPVRFNNVTMLIDLLKKMISENPSKDFLGAWALLFELYQREGRQSEFEDLGLEYAMGFEMSPPSWESVPVEAISTDAESANDPDTPTATQGYPLKGSVSLENVAHVQQQLIHHGASNREVHINMAGLQRIDFSAAGIFAETFTKLAAAGKKIVLIDINELIFPLLEAFGVHRVAVLLRRKAQ
ncbi:MAG: STAS domain-containing protein [Pseudomonadota bacterium]